MTFYDCCDCCEHMPSEDHFEAADHHSGPCPQGCNDGFREPGQ